MSAIAEERRVLAAPAAEPPRRRIANVVVGMRSDGGAESLIRTMLHEMRPTAYEVELFALRRVRPVNRREVDELGSRVEEFPAARLIDVPRFVSLLRRLRRGRFDVIHTHLAGANILGIACAKLLGVPVVVTLHSTRSSADSHWYHGRLERALVRRADRVLAVGEETATARQSVLGDVPIHVLPNAVVPMPDPSADDRRALREEFMHDHRSPLLLTVGRLEAAKAHDDLIRAFALVRQTWPGVELAIVGRGSRQEELAALVSELGLDGSVHLLGSRPDARRLMQACDQFVMSSHWEGLPMALLEAMEAGAPIVSTSVGDIPAVLAGTPSRLVDPADIDGLAAAMIASLDDRMAGVDLVTAGRRIVAERYSSAAWVTQLIGHYEAVLAGARPPRRDVRRFSGRVS